MLYGIINRTLGRQRENTIKHPRNRTLYNRSPLYALLALSCCLLPSLTSYLLNPSYLRPLFSKTDRLLCFSLLFYVLFDYRQTVD